jgi:protein-S-isoprenylcysteine O-methyltransferase Ste14
MPRNWPDVLRRNWPALIIGLVVSVYWFRVMMLVRAAPKVSGHGANLVPPEKLGRVLRFIWMPVILLWLVLPFAAFVVKYRKRYPEEFRDLLGLNNKYLPPWVGWAAALLAVVSLLATFVCWRRMGKSWRMGIDPKDKTQLVFSGPFAYVRHPIYGLSSLLMICTMIVIPSFLMIAAGVIHLILLQWEARREEQHLVRLHGDEYLRYAQSTGRFFPRSLRAYSGSSNNPANSENPFAKM